MNFDQEINRCNTKCIKFDSHKRHGKPADVFPMWVADMDFRCPEEVISDLKDRVDHGIFGYSVDDEGYFNAVKNWYLLNHATELKQEWLVLSPTVVFALATAVRTLTDEGDYVLINSPVYPPYTDVVVNNKRKIISSDLLLKNNHYEIDFDDFEKKISEYHIKLYLLCSPQNPTGRVWTKDELDKIVEICKKYDVYIVSDEVHSDFVWNKTHTCLFAYKDYLSHIILCTAPTKTFNIAGLQVANIFIPNKDLKEKYQQEIYNAGYDLLNVLGLVACQSAYENGQAWLKELKDYLLGNINYVDKFLRENLPKVKLIYPEGTYLLWLDFRELGLSEEKVEEILLNKAKLWFGKGTNFGEAGRGFQRMNIALPRKKLMWAMNQLAAAFKGY